MGGLTVSVVFYRNGTEIMDEVREYFVASRKPLYLGLIIKPSASVWEILKESSEVNLRIDNGEFIGFDIPYKIEVGENTVFFIKPQDGYYKRAQDVFLS